MTIYIFKRLTLLIPTLFAIITINFFIMQLSPGGPIENILAKMHGETSSESNSLTSTSKDFLRANSNYNNINRGSIDDEMRKELEKSFGFDKPIAERYINMLINYLKFDLEIV